jgi:hypothetical protein
VAQIVLTGITHPPLKPQRAGAISELAYSCTIEVDRDRRQPCYEWIAGDTSLDALNAPSESYHTLDFVEGRAFGWVSPTDAYWEAR